MTVLAARQPLNILSMSAVQSGSRRLSARLQEKEDHYQGSNGTTIGRQTSRDVNNATSSGNAKSKKRKNNYDEDDDGFTFSRVNKNKKQKQISPNDNPQPEAPRAIKVPTQQPTSPATRSKEKQNVVPLVDEVEAGQGPKKKRKKMSFSTPKVKESQPVRRSKRLSSEAARENDSPAPKAASKQPHKLRTQTPKQPEPQPVADPQVAVDDVAQDSDARAREDEREPETEHSATKIALPFADTPVIRRNKAMREGKIAKGDRRSSLGLRGRRASSLIDAGNSNALPHHEVEITDFYKHIESDLMEPRRMRQLLTWCATRAMHAKPKGTDFEDASAKSAARIIEEELLKELSTRSELSDWFSREDAPERPKPLPERPNPKNVQNVQKISELEEQISRLKAEKDALQRLLQPPNLSPIPQTLAPTESLHISTTIDPTLLSASDAAILESLNSFPAISSTASQRINNLTTVVGPAIDKFTDGIHKVAQYRTATDNIASKVLSICAEKLAERERIGRRKALQSTDDRSPKRDLGDVLRGLSRVDR